MMLPFYYKQTDIFNLSLYLLHNYKWQSFYLEEAFFLFPSIVGFLSRYPIIFTPSFPIASADGAEST